MSSPSNDAAGYASHAYASAIGLNPVPLGQTGGTLGMRDIGQSRLQDLSGAWPMFSCKDWTALGDAVGQLPSGFVSLTLVTDPFAALTHPDLTAIFPICRVLHEHWIIDLTSAISLSAHHRRKLRRAAPPRITIGPASADFASHWARLYDHLTKRKQITDSRAFSPSTLAAQLLVPGAEVVAAWQGDILLGADLYYLDRGVAYAHLSAYAPEGYAASISYPMMAAAIDHFGTKARAIDLGGAPGGAARAGIAEFKAGWTGLTRSSYLCGKVLDAAAYASLAPGADPKGWFPAYRAGEYET